MLSRVEEKYTRCRVESTQFEGEDMVKNSFVPLGTSCSSWDILVGTIFVTRRNQPLETFGTHLATIIRITRYVSGLFSQEQHTYGQRQLSP